MTILWVRLQPESSPPPSEQTDEIVFPTQRKHRIDQVMPDTRLALLDFEAVGEEVEEVPELSCQKYLAEAHPCCFC